jgi:hypothetical protein
MDLSEIAKQFETTKPEGGIIPQTETGPAKLEIPSGENIDVTEVLTKPEKLTLSENKIEIKLTLSENEIGFKFPENRIPRNDGFWDGEPGNSNFYPDREKTPSVCNPEGETWGEILDKHGIESIPFKDGYPDFSGVAEETVEIKDFTTYRPANFSQADEQFAEKRGCSPEEACQYRKDNRLTWHECEDQKTMQLVPSEVHNNIPHSGGVAEAKKQAAQEF